MSNKGFTLLETILVLSMVTLMYIAFIFKKPISSTGLVPIVQQIKEIILQEQLTAMNKKEKRVIQISESGVDTTDKHFVFPKGIWADAHTISYAANGNINQAQSVCLYNTKTKLCLVFQLGSGQIAIR